MPYKIKGKGTLRIDRNFKGIGRLQKSTGVVDKQTYELISNMLTELYRTGRHSIIREIIDGSVSLGEVFGYWTEGKLEHVPSASTLKPISEVIPSFIDKHEIADSTKRRYHQLLIALLAQTAGRPIVSDLPRLLSHFRDHSKQQGFYRNFNQTRSLLQSFLNHTLGRHHTLWEQVSHIKPLKIKEQKQAIQLSVVEAIGLIQSLPKAHADMVRTMLFTGMGFSELIGDWEVLSDRVLIHGTKQKGRDRMVPLIDPDLVKPTRGTKAFRIALKKVNPEISPYSFRRSYAHWMEECEIHRIRRRQYLGHGASDITARYERVQIDQFLREDAQRLRDYIYESWKDKDVEKDITPQRTIFLFKSRLPT